MARRLTEEVAGNAEYWNVLGLAHIGRAIGRRWPSRCSVRSRPARPSTRWTGSSWPWSVGGWTIGTKPVKLYRRGSDWMEKTLPYDERLVRTRDEAKGLLGVTTE